MSQVAYFGMHDTARQGRSLFLEKEAFQSQQNTRRYLQSGGEGVNFHALLTERGVCSSDYSDMVGGNFVEVEGGAKANRVVNSSVKAIFPFDLLKGAQTLKQGTPFMEASFVQKVEIDHVCTEEQKVDILSRVWDWGAQFFQKHYLSIVQQHDGLVIYARNCNVDSSSGVSDLEESLAGANLSAPSVLKEVWLNGKLIFSRRNV